MSEIHKFIFDGMPVRGSLVKLTDAWQEILRRHASNSHGGAFPQPVRQLLGEMAAAGVLMQSGIKFNGALLLQIFGDGPVKVAVAEVRSDLRVRATATMVGDVPADARLSAMVNLHNQGRCAITIDPQDKFPGQQPYQSMVPLFGDRGETLEKLGDALEHYMLQSEQLDTTLVLAADDNVAAGLLLQRIPVEGTHNLAGSLISQENEAQIGADEDFNRLSHLASSLQREELLTLDVDTILRRLFWEEPLARFVPQEDDPVPRFECSCSAERVRGMIRGLGRKEAESIVAERGEIEVGCEFCGRQYRFDAVDADQIFAAGEHPLPGTMAVQ